MSTAVVIDNGSHTIKGGFAGPFAPASIFPAKVARKVFDSEHTQILAGNDVAKQLEKSQTYQLSKHPRASQPVDIQVSQSLKDHNNVDWEGIEHLWQYLMFDKLQLDKIRAGVAVDAPRTKQNINKTRTSSAYDDLNLLLSHHPTDSIKYKSKLLEIGYETFDADGMFLAPTTTLGLYSVGKLTGTVIDSGYHETFVSSIYEGYMLPFSVQVSKFGGSSVDHFLQSITLQNPKHIAALYGPDEEKTKRSSGRKSSSRKSSRKVETKLNTLVTLIECEKMKIKFCYCAQDFFEEETMYNNQDSSAFATNYKLPDGSILTMRNEKYQACELMFQPKLGNLRSENGIPEAIYESVIRCNNGMQKEMFENIVVTGGNTMMPGFVQRLNNGLAHFAPASMKIKISAPPNRIHAAFTGGSILASQDSIKDVWINKKMYEEMGQQCIAIRCF